MVSGILEERKDERMKKEKGKKGLLCLSLAAQESFNVHADDKKHQVWQGCPLVQVIGTTESLREVPQVKGQTIASSGLYHTMHLHKHCNAQLFA